MTDSLGHMLIPKLRRLTRMLPYDIIFPDHGVAIARYGFRMIP